MRTSTRAIGEEIREEGIDWRDIVWIELSRNKVIQ